MTLGEKIKKLRSDNNLTQEQLAQMLFVTRTAVSKWETDKGLPGIDTLKLISSTFNVSLDDLVSDDVVESTRIIEKKRAKIMYAVAVGFLAVALNFTLTTYLTGIKYFTIGSLLGTVGFVVFAILSRPKYRRADFKKYLIAYIISRLVILIFVLGLIIYTILTL